MRNIKIIHHGDPVPQQRARTAIVKGRVINYDPPKCRQYKQELAYTASFEQSFKVEPLHLKIRIYRPIPKSFSKKKRREALEGKVLPATKPDLKNYVAGIEDALEGVVFKNDSQIISYDCAKYYGDPPRIEVEFTPIK